MYEELVKQLRNCADLHGECALCQFAGNPCDEMPETPLVDAADAIEELSKELDAVNDAHVVYCKDCPVPHNRYTGCPMWGVLSQNLIFIVDLEKRREITYELCR